MRFSSSQPGHRREDLRFLIGKGRFAASHRHGGGNARNRPCRAAAQEHRGRGRPTLSKRRREDLRQRRFRTVSTPCAGRGRVDLVSPTARAFSGASARGERRRRDVLGRRFRGRIKLSETPISPRLVHCSLTAISTYTTIRDRVLSQDPQLRDFRRDLTREYPG